MPDALTTSVVTPPLPNSPTCRSGHRLPCETKQLPSPSVCDDLIGSFHREGSVGLHQARTWRMLGAAAAGAPLETAAKSMDHVVQ